MPENWSGVAAEIAVAIAEIGIAVTLRRPATGGPSTPFDPTPEPPDQEFTIRAVPEMERVRNSSGTLIGTTRDTLMVSASGVVPQKKDSVLVRGTWREVDEVRTLHQGGVDLLYELVLLA